MSKKDISLLIKRYEEAEQEGIHAYFDADEFGELAEYYDSNDDIDAAREIIDKGLAIHPKNDSLLVKKAKFAVYDGEYALALDILGTISQEYDFDLYLLKIECYLQLELYNEAISLSKEMLEKEENEDMDNILAELGFLYVEADCFKEAVVFFKESIDYNPENVDVLSDLAYAEEMLGDFNAAIEATNKILDIDPYTYEAWINIGKLYTLKEDYAKAIDAFDFALTINDSDSNILKLKAHCLSMAGRTEEAIGIFNDLIQSDPDDATVYFLLAECYQTLEMYDKSLECLYKYDEIQGETPESISKKAYIYVQKGDFVTATNTIQEGLIPYPSSSDLNMMAGEIAFKEEDYSKAKLYYLAIYPQNSENFHLTDRLALISIKQEDYEKAIFYTEKLLELDPYNQAVKERLALLYFEVDNKVDFNNILDEFTDSELMALFKIFYEPANPQYFDRKTLITYLNDARETRTLFKNLKY